MVGRVVKRCKVVQLRCGGGLCQSPRVLRSWAVLRISAELFNSTEAEGKSCECFCENGGFTVQSRGIVFGRLRLISIGRWVRVLSDGW